jgi:hypothetical protein
LQISGYLENKDNKLFNKLENLEKTIKHLQPELSQNLHKANRKLVKLYFAVIR